MRSTQVRSRAPLATTMKGAPSGDSRGEPPLSMTSTSAPNSRWDQKRSDDVDVAPSWAGVARDQSSDDRPSTSR